MKLISGFRGRIPAACHSSTFQDESNNLILCQLTRRSIAVHFSRSEVTRFRIFVLNVCLWITDGYPSASKTFGAATAVCCLFSSRRMPRSDLKATVLRSAASAASRFQDENFTSSPLRPVPPRWSSACRQNHFRHEVRAASALAPVPYEDFAVPSRFLVCGCCSLPWTHSRR